MKQTLFEVKLSAVRRSTGKLIGITKCAAFAETALEAVPIVLGKLDSNDVFYDLVDDYYARVLDVTAICDRRKSKRRGGIKPIEDRITYLPNERTQEYLDAKLEALNTEAYV